MMMRPSIWCPRQRALRRVSMHEMWIAVVEELRRELKEVTFRLHKVAIPIVPPIRVIVSFTKFEVLEPSEQFSTPPSSPTHSRDAKSDGSTSWISWMKRKSGGQPSESSNNRHHIDEVDPSHIPSDYIWDDAKRCSKPKKTKIKKNPKQASVKSGEMGHPLSEEAKSEDKTKRKPKQARATRKRDIRRVKKRSHRKTFRRDSTGPKVMRGISRRLFIPVF
ncbi:hypothetical protein Droror1_Dr00002064 [Drosera rotundifolia]